MSSSIPVSARSAGRISVRKSAGFQAVASPVPSSGRTVLVWCSSCHPAGGMERIALSIANGLSALGWRVVLAGPFTNAPALHAGIRPEVDFIHHSPHKSVPGLLRTFFFIRRIVRQHRVDAVSAHGSVFPLLFTPVPVVWTEHDIRYGGGSMLRGLRSLAWRRVRALLLRGRWQLVTVSYHVRSQLARNLNLLPDNGTVIYNGLPHAEALRALPPPRMRPPYRIGFIGRLVEFKHPLEVFELSTRLNSMGIPHEWNVFGEGLLMPEMRSREQRSSGHSVRIRGLAKKPQDAFSEMDLLCFHSRGEQEGLGMVLLEAMAANRPVVAWDSGCIAEVLGARGTLVPPPFSLERFAEAIVSVLRTWKHRPPEADQRWDEGRMVSDYDSVLNRAIYGKTPAEGGRTGL